MLAGNKKPIYLCGILFESYVSKCFFINSLVSSLVGSLVSVVEKGGRQAALFFFYQRRFKISSLSLSERE